MFSQGCVYLYDSEGSVTELFDIHNADFVGIDCLTAGTQYCVVREWLFRPMQGHSRQSVIVDSTLWIPDSRVNNFLVSGTWILDSIRWGDSAFLGLSSGF